jgi:hypothetical protein
LALLSGRLKASEGIFVQARLSMPVLGVASILGWATRTWFANWELFSYEARKIAETFSEEKRD